MTESASRLSSSGCLPGARPALRPGLAASDAVEGEACFAAAAAAATAAAVAAVAEDVVAAGGTPSGVTPLSGFGFSTTSRSYVFSTTRLGGAALSLSAAAAVAVADLGSGKKASVAGSGFDGVAVGLGCDWTTPPLQQQQQ